MSLTNLIWLPFNKIWTLQLHADLFFFFMFTKLNFLGCVTIKVYVLWRALLVCKSHVNQFISSYGLFSLIFFSNIQCVFQWIICKCHLSSVYATVKLLILGVLPYHCEATSSLFESFFSPHRCSAIFLHDLGYFCFWLVFSLDHFIYSSFIFNFAFGCCARYTISNLAA